MLTPRGVCDNRDGTASAGDQRVAAADGTPRSRAELLDSRRRAQSADAGKWAGAQSPRAMRCDMYRQDAVAAASTYMSKLIQQSATAADASAADSRLDRDACAASGVRSVPGREEHCTTTFSSVCSKRIDPSRRSQPTAPDWVHASADADAAVDFPGSTVRESAENSFAALPQELPGGRPILPNRRRRYQQVARTVGRVPNVTGASTRAWMHKTYIHRPEVGTLDSYDVPVFSCFSGDKAFHPEMDRVLKKKKEAERAKRREELKKLRERDAHHRVVAREFEATLDRVRRMKEAAREAHSHVAIFDDDEATLRALEEEAARARREAAVPAPPAVPYDPHKAAKTPRSSVPGRPSERLLSAAIKAAADEASTADTASAPPAEPAGKPAQPTPSPRRRPTSSPLRRALSPAALAAKQALEFKVSARRTSSDESKRPASAAPADATGPRAASRGASALGSNGNGMDLFALTRVHTSTPQQPAGAAGPTPPPQPRPASTLHRPTSAHASKRARPLSARAALRGADSPWGVQDNFAGGAFSLQSASGSRSRPQSARARVASADAP